MSKTSGPAKPVRRPSGIAREEQLLERALTLFSEAGYRETSLQQIADHLGITRPLFYYYFKSKEDLLSRLIGHLGDAMLEQARPSLESGDAPIDVLYETFRTHVGVLVDNREAFRVYLAERNVIGSDPATRLALAGEEQYMGLITAVIAHGQEQGQIRVGSPRVLALLAIGLVNSVLRWYVPGGAMSKEALQELTASMAAASLRP